MSALRHLRIIELATSVAGEYAGKLIADFGAEIIKVEPPGTGSPTRHMGPFAPNGADPERSGLFAYLNTNKRSVTLDLESDEGKAALARLVAASDAVIDDHAPGWLAEVGIDPATALETWPQLVLCSITPFGQEAGQKRSHSSDLIIMQASGWGYHTPSAADPSKPPLKGAGRFLPSYECGLEAALTTIACLIDGKGRFIDISQQAVMASRVDYVLGPMVAGDMDVGEARSQFDLGGPGGIFPCRNGHIYVFMSAPAHWTALQTLFGNPEWAAAYPANWLERGLTPERIAEVRGALVDWLSALDKDDAAQQAQELGLTLVPLNNADDLIRSPQFQHRGFFTQVDHPQIGAALYPGVPYRLSLTPAVIERPAPLLGEHDGIAA